MRNPACPLELIQTLLRLDLGDGFRLELQWQQQIPVVQISEFDTEAIPAFVQLGIDTPVILAQAPQTFGWTHRREWSPVIYRGLGIRLAGRSLARCSPA